MKPTLPTIALFLAVVPSVIININYLIAANEGYVPWCVPYWDSCTSISATGREGTAFYFFKATMIPLAFLYMWYWRLANEKLAQFGYKGKAIQSLGLIASLALIIYTISLGAVGDNFQLTRRIGIIFYFTLTYLCQLLVVHRITTHNVADTSRHWQTGLCLIVLAVGILSLILDLTLDNYDDYEDAFEWVIALLLHLNFFVAYWGWRSGEVYDAGSINTE